jgi:thiamine pyrophosphate-dependent acetolactate synthase large subunit-like protein
MKNLITVISVTVALLAAPVVSAVEEHHPDQKPATAPTTQSPPKDPEQVVKQMKENADKLRVQVDKIAKTKDPAARQKLVQEHMQMLRAGMATAGSMMGSMGAGPGGGMGMGMMGGGMTMDCPMMGQMMGGGMMGEQMMQRMQQMEKRMDMMQMMLEQTRKP